MCITEYDEQRAFAGQRADGYEEGIAEGEIKRTMKVLANMARKGKLSLEDASEEAGMTTIEFGKITGLVT